MGFDDNLRKVPGHIQKTCTENDGMDTNTMPATKINGQWAGNTQNTLILANRPSPKLVTKEEQTEKQLSISCVSPDFLVKLMYFYM